MNQDPGYDPYVPTMANESGEIIGETLEFDLSPDKSGLPGIAGTCPLATQGSWKGSKRLVSQMANSKFLQGLVI